MAPRPQSQQSLAGQSAGWCFVLRTTSTTSSMSNQFSICPVWPRIDRLAALCFCNAASRTNIALCHRFHRHTSQGSRQTNNGHYRTDHKRHVLLPIGRFYWRLFFSRNMSRKLPHYLRIERRRAGLSQTDIGALLGVRTGSKISRYEHGRRLPPLKTALAYEAILGKPIAELFGGTFAAIEGEVQRRARSLESLGVRPPRGSRFFRRKESLETIAAR